MKAKPIFIPVLFFIIVAVAVVALFHISRSRTFQFFGELVSRVETDEKVVALTFDDAPSSKSDEVLRILNEYDIKATFYVVGRNMEAYPEEGKRIAGMGHDLGNHSYSHERFLLKPFSFIASEIERTNGLIRKTGYKDIISFRPPNGKKLIGLPWYLARRDITTVMWDVEPDTYVLDGLNEKEREDFIVSYTVENTKPGSIILLHPFCGRQCDADRKALPRIIGELKKRGYRFTTVSNLVDSPN